MLLRLAIESLSAIDAGPVESENAPPAPIGHRPADAPANYRPDRSPADTPEVSRVAVVMPIYNRAAWLAEAFDALAQQSFRDFRLIVVDDGSTDDTADRAANHLAAAPFPATLLRQRNRGPGPARQAGVDHALSSDDPLADATDYLAFYDSDDRWACQHLADCVAELDRHADVDWVFASVRVIDEATGNVLVPDVFTKPGTPRPILDPALAEVRGDLRVLTHPDTLAHQLAGDNLAGFQASVIRRRLFDPACRGQSPPPLRIPGVGGEDRVFTALALTHGYRLAYLPAVHADYRVHPGNNSGADAHLSWPKRRRTLRRHAFGLRYLRRTIDPRAHPDAHRLATDALARHLFWHLGYHSLPHEPARALGTMRRALSLDPGHADRWKTYAVARLRHLGATSVGLRRAA
ncbi:MAG: glycosyltransferase [Planctomycetota bacterium]